MVKDDLATEPSQAASSDHSHNTPVSIPFNNCVVDSMSKSHQDDLVKDFWKSPVNYPTMLQVFSLSYHLLTLISFPEELFQTYFKVFSVFSIRAPVAAAVSVLHPGLLFVYLMIFDSIYCSGLADFT